MGEFADDVNARPRDALAGQCPGEWNTEHRVAGTPVDVVGALDGRTVCVELEWRRADPADNTAKLFRHLTEDALAGEVVVCQVFTRYYDIAAGGISSKRENAEFVGGVAERALDGFEYHAVEFDLDPPKRGGDRSPPTSPTASRRGYNSTSPSSSRSIMISRGWPSGSTFS